MRSTVLVVAAAGVTGLVLFAGVGGVGEEAASQRELAQGLTLTELANLAIAADESIAGAAINRLRDAGQEGLDALFTSHSEIAKRAVTHTRCEKAETNRWRCAVDAVARQRDAAFSRLFWHTDLEQAKAVAAERNLPILALRMLGELHEEYSCANSRYFRTVLYADPTVADYLRDNFVLHWETVRPVPRITIDMGDGRVIDRTITGNSVHYVLNSEGRVLDVVPGLWDAASFREVLNDTGRDNWTRGTVFGEPGALNTANVQFDNAPTFDLSKSLGERSMLAEVRGGGRSAAGVSDPAVETAPVASVQNDAGILEQPRERPTVRISALEAGEVSPSKRGVEFMTLANMQRLEEFYNNAPQPTTPAGEVNSIPLSELSSHSQHLMWQKRFGADADPNNPEQQRVMQSMIASFQRSLAEDTALNRDQLRPRALSWLEQTDLANDVKRLNDRVYAELFLSPLDDPWMGLVPSDAYAALPDEGLIQP